MHQNAEETGHPGPGSTTHHLVHYSTVLPTLGGSAVTVAMGRQPNLDLGGLVHYLGMWEVATIGVLDSALGNYLGLRKIM